MTIIENADVFFEKKVQDFGSAADWKGSNYAYRLRIDWNSQPDDLTKALQELAKHPEAAKLQALVIGAWHGEDSSRSSAGIIDEVVKQKASLSGLKAIFLGDIICEENEISWIEQSDVSPLLVAFPGLEVLRVRGGNGLKFSKVKHDGLKQLIVETGGLPRSVIREICRCDFPNLEHLELWLGVADYGWDGEVGDLQPILAGKHFPKLSYLGLCNTDIADEITAVVVNAPVLQQLKVLDLSKGTISDVGAQALLNLPSNIPLEELNLDHHYMTPDMVKKLRKTLTCKVSAEDAHDPDSEWRATLVSE